MRALSRLRRRIGRRTILYLAVVGFIGVLATASTVSVAMARTRPVVEAGDPDIGNEKPRSGPSHASVVNGTKPSSYSGSDKMRAAFTRYARLLWYHLKSAVRA